MNAVAIIILIGAVLIFGSLLIGVFLVGNLSKKELEQMGVNLSRAHDRQNHYKV